MSVHVCTCVPLDTRETEEPVSVTPAKAESPVPDTPTVERAERVESPRPVSPPTQTKRPVSPEPVHRPSSPFVNVLVPPTLNIKVLLS